MNVHVKKNWKMQSPRGFNILHFSLRYKYTSFSCTFPTFIVAVTFCLVSVLRNRTRAQCSIVQWKSANPLSLTQVLYCRSNDRISPGRSGIEPLTSSVWTRLFRKAHKLIHIYWSNSFLTHFFFFLFNFTLLFQSRLDNFRFLLMCW